MAAQCVEQDSPFSGQHRKNIILCEYQIGPAWKRGFSGAASEDFASEAKIIINVTCKKPHLVPHSDLKVGASVGF